MFSPFSRHWRENKQDKQIQISYFLLNCFFLKPSHTNWPPICVFIHKWTSNEWREMKMKSHRVRSFCTILHWRLTTAAQMFGISDRRSCVFHRPPPSPSPLQFFLFSRTDGLAPTVAQFNIYTLPSVWFPPQREMRFHVSDLPQQRFSSPF